MQNYFYTIDGTCVVDAENNGADIDIGFLNVVNEEHDRAEIERKNMEFERVNRRKKNISTFLHFVAKILVGVLLIGASVYLCKTGFFFDNKIRYGEYLVPVCVFCYWLFFSFGGVLKEE